MADPGLFMNTLTATGCMTDPADMIRIDLRMVITGSLH
jgi:hypothetical protein